MILLFPSSVKRLIVNEYGSTRSFFSLSAKDIKLTVSESMNDGGRYSEKKPSKIKSFVILFIVA